MLLGVREHRLGIIDSWEDSHCMYLFLRRVVSVSKISTSIGSYYIRRNMKFNFFSSYLNAYLEIYLQANPTSKANQTGKTKREAQADNSTMSSQRLYTALSQPGSITRCVVRRDQSRMAQPRASSTPGQDP